MHNTALRVVSSVLYKDLIFSQVWSVCYNVNGTKIASVSDDKALYVYGCPHE